MAGRRRSPPNSSARSSAAGAAPALSPGASRSRAKRAAFATRSIGAGRCPVLATRAPRARFSGWPRPRTAATAPAGSSPAIARATSCSRRCGAPGFANQPHLASRSTTACSYITCWITAAVRCAPPPTGPTPAGARKLPAVERARARVAAAVRVIVCLGGFAWDAALRLRAQLPTAVAVPTPEPRFGHGAECRGDHLTLLGCYHPSQQNTFTGRLTEPMIDAVLNRARALAGQ